MPDQPHVLTEHDGHTFIVTLNRPEARNALSAEMLVTMCDAWQEVDENPDIRVAILTGAGDCFCAGADLKAMGGNPEADKNWTQRIMADIDLPWKALLKKHLLSKPLIAAVEGAAIAGGTEILQGTDIRIAGVSARFGVAEARHGLFPLGGSTVRLRRQIPYTLAAEMLLTGKHLSAQEALEIGLIGRVVPDGQALDEARKVAEQIASNGPIAVQAILKSLRETEGIPERQAFDIEAKIGLPVFATEDAREGPRAFSEKRTPDFKGR